MSTINYADALKKKVPQPVGDVKREESGGKCSRQTQSERQRPTPSNNTEQQQSLSTQHHGASAWGRPDVSMKKNPSMILKRPKQEESTVGAQEATLSKPPPPTAKRPKKPKPSSKMSLGDVMPNSMVVAPKKLKVERIAPPKQEPVEMSSQEQFPSLMSSSSAPSTSAKPSLPAHAGWGKKPAPKKEKTVKKIITKQAPKKTPQAIKPSAATKQPQPKKDPPPKPSLLDFGAKQRTDEDRGENDLIRLLQNKKEVKKGRQRLGPCKKKFSTLKKKVLQERLEAYRKLHPEEDPTTTTTAATTTDPTGTSTSISCTVCLRNFAEAEEVEDDDEHEEIVDNLKEMGTKVGPIRDAFVQRLSSGSCPAFVWFETPKSANEACACWNGLVVGGQKLEPILLSPTLQESGESDASNKAWRSTVVEAFDTEKTGAVNGPTPRLTSRVIVRNALSKDDFDDKEHLEESLSYIRSLVEQHGTVSDLEAKQEGDGSVVIVTYAGDVSIAKEAVAKLDGLVVGGTAISVSLSEEAKASDQVFVIELKNALTEDDLEDEDCLQESLNDIEALGRKHGPLLSSEGAVKANGTSVVLRYHGDPTVAKDVATALDGTLLGGNIVQASVVSPSYPKQASIDTSGWVLLQNILSDDDLEDEEALEESIEDVRELAGRYGKVLNVTFDPNDLTRVVRIEYEGGSEVAFFAAERFNNMVLGGQTIAAIALASDSDPQNLPSTEITAATTQEAKPADDTPKPLYSGDKLIPERFAECKRVPKVLTSTGPRDYASLSSNEEVIPLLIEMLGELMRLQRRAVEDKNAKARRRIVMGLREVARGIRAHKVKMVVMANNVDQYGAIDEKLQEILDLARQEDVPVIFELNKRKLGKAVGKSIKVSVVGIQSAEGAHQQFKKLTALASKT